MTFQYNLFGKIPTFQSQIMPLQAFSGCMIQSKPAKVMPDAYPNLHIIHDKNGGNLQLIYGCTGNARVLRNVDFGLFPHELQMSSVTSSFSYAFQNTAVKQAHQIHNPLGLL